MTTSEVLTERALSLAGAGAAGEDAVQEQAEDPTTHAVELLDAVLARLPV